MARDAVRFIRDPERWRAALSPIRAEIVQGLRCLGPCSAGELAKLLDRPADTLYRHIERLEEAGYVCGAGERKRGRHVERLFDVTADDFGMDLGAVTGEVREAIESTANTFLGAMIRTVRESLEAGAMRLPPDPTFLLNYEVSWLTPEKFKRARAILYELKKLMDEARPTGEGTLYASVTVVVPVTRKRRRKGADGVRDAAKPAPAANGERRGKGAAKRAQRAGSGGASPSSSGAGRQPPPSAA